MPTRRNFLRLLAFLPWMIPVVALARHSVEEIRHNIDKVRERVVFEFNGKVTVKGQNHLTNPPRLYIDVSSADLPKSVKLPNFSANGVVKGLRSFRDKRGVLRLVLDLRRVFGGKDQVRKWVTSDGKRDRIVVDFAMPQGWRPLPEKKPVRSEPRQYAEPQYRFEPKPRIVVIDPGHGGKDPGAVGRRRTREKDVALNISRYLHGLLKADPSITPYMTRTQDEFLRLQKRTKIARDYGANFFISVHADAARRRSARGASVYMLSTKGESSAEARWLANRENAADLVGGVKLAGQDEDLQKTIYRMSQGAVHEYSGRAVRVMIDALKRSVPMHNTRIGRAGFLVLTSAGIPSILVETGFISNAKDEKRLKSAWYQKKVAKALYQGIREYYRDNPEYN